MLCGLLEGKQALAGGKDSVGALWAAGGKTSPDGAKALCGLCGLLEGSEMFPQRFFGYVLRARLLNLQFSKTAFFLKRGAAE